MSGSALERFFLRAWYERQSWLVVLRPVSALYAALATRRRARYLSGHARQWTAPVPVIVVGNLTLGGTGKTPMCLWLIAHLQARGLRVGVISRGYGADPGVFPRFVTPSDLPSRSGDEPLLIARRTSVPVVIDPDRPRGCRALLEQHEVDVIISDDGLQHYRLARAVEIVMVDHARGLGNGRCLPEGPLREPVQRLNSVDLVVRNGAPEETGNQYAMRLAPTALVNILTGERKALDRWDDSREVEAVAGIGNPQRFFDTLQQLGFVPRKHAFADHAHYNADSFASLERDRPVIMTEKDAVKCAGLAQDNWWYLSVEAVLSDEFAQGLDACLPKTPISGVR
ncbi:tetraacyldisaccharide 4'-kinase [Halopseudomonas nanhaiensis]|uniref:tetraacyldisaccharide 4'-kinase n=1 Tax=Halopseudomonas nanhaiensis TaxID=2830842 RepID=UPI001CBB1BCF|nr:tetraacyldisaccharide 4'-kinase [Halopseudomonas nanhaiensis]UAW96967.1 tetraacyldisaccharide 4'-kinase [Halopseudomonas nanhaiensis]